MARERKKPSTKPGKFYKPVDTFCTLVPPVNGYRASSTKALRVLLLQSFDRAVKTLHNKTKGVLAVDVALVASEEQGLQLEIAGYLPMTEEEKKALRSHDRERRKKRKEQRAVDRANAFREYNRIKEKYKFE